MTDQRWLRVKGLFQAALERPAGERDAFLAAETGDDEALRRRFSERNGEVSPDGRWLAYEATTRSGDQAAVPASLVVVQNWREDLNRLVAGP